jgi:hypothetical protein
MGAGRVLTLFALFYFLLVERQLKSVLIFKYEVFLIALLSLYTLLVNVVGRGSAYIIPYDHLLFIFDCILVPIFIYKVFYRYIDFSRLDQSLILVGLLSALATIILILYPGFNFYLREKIIIDDLDSGTVQDGLRYIRGFTFSDSSTFGFGITQGIIFGLVLNRTRFDYRYAIFFLPILISIAFNARIGFVVCLVAIVLLLKFLRVWLLLTFVVVGMFILVPILFFYVNDDYIESFLWAFDFFSETFDFITGSEREFSTYNVLLNDMIIYPDSGLSLFFGEGSFAVKNFVRSDIGYINQIFIGGLFYVGLLTASLVFYYKRFIFANFNSFLRLFFFITFVIINIKGLALFTSQSFTRLFMMFYITGKLMNLRVYGGK